MADSEQVPLTSLSHGAGWACKLAPGVLAQVLAAIPRAADVDLLVGADTADDAAVYRIGPDEAIVFTVDYFTPIVDDPYQFGRIAAANAFSDTWAMGGDPRLALNIVGFPSRTLPVETLQAILRGGSEMAAEAGVLVAGGHSIDDPEPKYGMAVIGFVHPDRVITNVGARPGDILFLTKPLGIGIIATGIKRGVVSQETIDEAVRLMTTLNRGGARAMRAVGVRAATDVTGFGLLGHLREMLAPGNIGARVHLSQVPVLDEAWTLVRQDVCPGGTERNLASVECQVDFAADIDQAERLMLCDAQTSGGLLIAVAPDKADALEQALQAENTLSAARIGLITGDPDARIIVER